MQPNHLFCNWNHSINAFLKVISVYNSHKISTIVPSPNKKVLCSIFIRTCASLKIKSTLSNSFCSASVSQFISFSFSFSFSLIVLSSFISFFSHFLHIVSSANSVSVKRQGVTFDISSKIHQLSAYTMQQQQKEDQKTKEDDSLSDLIKELRYVISYNLATNVFELWLHTMHNITLQQ